MKIVVGHDGSKDADAALDAAIEMARQADAEIIIVCGEDRPADWAGMTYRGIPLEVEHWLAEWDRQVAEDLERAASRAREAGVRVSTACAREHPVDLMIKVAHDVGASWIVVGAKGAGTLHAVVMGSNTMRLLHHSDLPVLVVPLRQ
jgi:nucleotide-binding universal stress UspA family protein